MIPQLRYTLGFYTGGRVCYLSRISGTRAAVDAFDELVDACLETGQAGAIALHGTDDQLVLWREV